MLGTRTLRKGGVMIRWLGHLGRYVGASDHATFCFSLWCLLWLRSGAFIGHIIITFTFT